MVSLDNSQKGQLEKWQEEYKRMSNRQVKTEEDLKGFENLSLDVDGAKNQSADLKVNVSLLTATRCNNHGLRQGFSSSTVSYSNSSNSVQRL